MYGILLLLHILGATIWTGGHIVLAVTVLPKALREKSPQRLIDFESAYEKIGIPALLVQIVTGIMLAYRFSPDVSQWFDMSHSVAHAISAKIILLILTLGFAIHARFRVIPVLSEKNLVVMAWHIIPVTVMSILLVFVGVSFRTGWLY